MPKFMKVATSDELEDQQAKLVEVEGQKIALFRAGGQPLRHLRRHGETVPGPGSWWG